MKRMPWRLAALLVLSACGCPSQTEPPRAGTDTRPHHDGLRHTALAPLALVASDVRKAPEPTRSAAVPNDVGAPSAPDQRIPAETTDSSRTGVAAPADLRRTAVNLASSPPDFLLKPTLPDGCRRLCGQLFDWEMVAAVGDQDPMIALPLRDRILSVREELVHSCMARCLSEFSAAATSCADHSDQLDQIVDCLLRAGDATGLVREPVQP